MNDDQILALNNLLGPFLDGLGIDPSEDMIDNATWAVVHVVDDFLGDEGE